MDDTDDQRQMTRRAFIHETSALRFSSPLFCALARSCATDNDMVGLGSAARAGQPLGMFILLTVQYLLFKSPQAPLAAYFPSMTPAPKPAAEAFPVFREFCLDNRPELLRLLAARTVNTNLVERTSCSLPAIRYVGGLVDGPLTLVEICCSAGLNLLFDEYYHDYGPAGRAGPADSPVRLGCKVIGRRPPPLGATPQVVQRIGVDLVKMDVTDPDERLWMEAMLCPEWTRERAQLKAALSMRAERKLRLVIGNALTVLPELLEELPGPVLVLHSYCMEQWPTAARNALDDILRKASHGRDIHRLGLEVPDEEPAASIRARLATLVSAGIPIQQKCLPSRIEHTWYKESSPRSSCLAYSDGFGAWLDWQAAD
jgi:hypothetical protein